jgi:hypothetical protein
LLLLVLTEFYLRSLIFSSPLIVADVAMSRGSYRTAQVLALRGWFPAIEIVRPTAEADAASEASSSSSVAAAAASSSSSSSSSSSASDSLQSAGVRFAHRFAAFHRLVQPQPLQISQLLIVLDRHRKHARATLEAKHALEHQAQLQMQQPRQSAKQSPPPLSESMPAAELEALVSASEVRAVVNEALTEFKRIKPLADRVQVCSSAVCTMRFVDEWCWHHEESC